jgi:hypothetical protein
MLCSDKDVCLLVTLEKLARGEGRQPVEKMCLREKELG